MERERERGREGERMTYINYNDKKETDSKNQKTK